MTAGTAVRDLNHHDFCVGEELFLSRSWLAFFLLFLFFFGFSGTDRDGHISID